MELTCELVLLIVACTAASPHGYGIKGGAVAKASAVAGANIGVGDIPISVPSNTGYSGSYSKSFSSSSSSSSASSSSSSSSFSYSGSGSGSNAFPGSVGANGCDSGNCHRNPTIGALGSVGVGSQAFTVATSANNLSSLGGSGGNTLSGSYGHKDAHGGSQTNSEHGCGSEGCQESKNTLPSSDAETSAQTTSNAKAIASSGAGLSTSICGGSGCSNSPGGKCASGDCDSSGSSNTDSDENINKCSSGDCGTDSYKKAPSSYNEGETCISGQCGTNKDTESSSTSDHSTNDVHAPISKNSDSKSNDGDSDNSNNLISSTTLSESGCSNGNCGPTAPTNLKPFQNPSTASGSPTTPGHKPAIHLTTPKLDSSCTNSNCQNAPNDLPAQHDSEENNLSCEGGICGKKIKTTNSANLNQISSSSNNGPSKARPYNYYDFPPYPPAEALDSPCSPGTPGCAITSPVTSSYPSASGYSGSTNIKPSSGPSCAPGDPSCSIIPSDCVSGNCGLLPSSPTSSGSVNTKPSYGTSLSDSPANPKGPNCAPGSSGCSITTNSVSSECASGNCGASSPSVPGYSGKISASYPPSIPTSPDCLPGTLGCSPLSSNPSSSNKAPFNTHKIPTSHSPVKTSLCAPGTPGCTLPPISGPSGCASGNCGASSNFPGYSVPSNIKPSHSSFVPGISSDLPVNPPGSNCAPGTPGCTIPSISGPSVCTSGNCGASSSSVPGYSGKISASYSPSIPTSPDCLPGTLGCSPLPANPTTSNNAPINSHKIPTSHFPVKTSLCTPGTPGCTLTPSISGPSGCASGNCGTSPYYPGHSVPSNIKPIHSSFVPGISSDLPVNPPGSNCAPGTPGCAIPSISRPPICALGNCGASSSYLSAPSSISCSPGKPGCGTTVPISFSTSPDNYNAHLPSHSNVKPSGLSCAPGTSGCPTTTDINSPSDCATGNCGSAGYGGSLNFKPSYSQNNLPLCSPGSPGCTTSSVVGPSSCAPGTPGCALSSQTITSPSAPAYGASAIGTTLSQTTFGSHGAGSIQATYNKPSTGLPASGSYTPGPSSGFPTAPSSTSVLPAYVPGIGSPPYNKPTSGSSSAFNNVGTAAGGFVQEDKPYSGGFGGPTGILNPNENNFTPFKTSTIKPTTSVGTSAIQTPCISGNCHLPEQTSPSLSQGGSNSGTVISAATSVSADAVAYTGGFGGPPGFLKPYDNGKIDFNSPSGKQLQDSSSLYQGLGGAGGHSTYSNGGTQASGKAVAQANAATFSSSGGYGIGSTGGCGGGCGGSYSGSLNHSKAGVLNGLSTAVGGGGALASAGGGASASSDANVSGGSYASSSASARATAGVSIKGGYGRR